MSTVAEIESAIESLPAEKVLEVAAWLEKYKASLSGDGVTGKLFMRFAGCLEGASDLSQRKGFSTK